MVKTPTSKKKVKSGKKKVQSVGKTTSKKRINTRQKGNRTQLELIKHLESLGCIVSIVERSGRHLKVKDCFGLFDLIAIKDKGNIYFIQVKTTEKAVNAPFLEFSSKHYDCYQIVRRVVKGKVQWLTYKYSNGHVHRYIGIIL